MSPQLTLIVAATRTNGIGARGSLPWRLPNEMAYFARTTKSAGIPSSTPTDKINVVIMGRKTWESIPPKFRPLKDRLNIIISSKSTPDVPTLKNENATSPVVCPSFEEAVSFLSKVSKPSLGSAFVIGGASVYSQALQRPDATRILLTRILEPAYDECDVFFPEINDKIWTRASHAELEEWAGFDVAEGVQEENGTKYEFQMWVRADAA